MEGINRRKFIQLTGLATAGLVFGPDVFAKRVPASGIKAVAFDAFPIFDPRPIFKTVNEIFPEKGKQIVDTWLAKQFGYQWLRTAGHQYKNFWDVTTDALRFALTQLQVAVDEQTVARIMNNYKTLNAWPDVAAGLESLRKSGVAVSFLSNMTESMLRQGLQNAGIEKYFDHVISTDWKQTYKPAPDAYKLGIETLGLKKEEILFVPFAGWDLAGAKWFGYQTFWMNRLSAPNEKLDAEPDGVGTGMNDLVSFITK